MALPILTYSKNNKAPTRQGVATEKTLTEKETTGFKEIVKLLQAVDCDEYIFDFLAIACGGSSLTGMI